MILWRTTPGGTKTTCLDVFAGEFSADTRHTQGIADSFAGGDLTIFAVQRSDGSGIPYVDVLSCGNGQYGGLGNAQYSNAQSSPVRAKNVSGLSECKLCATHAVDDLDVLVYGEIIC